MNPPERPCSDAGAEGGAEEAHAGPAVTRSEADEQRRMSQWQKQVDFGKNTLGYATYVKLVPKEDRRRDDPQTPDVQRGMSKKRFDGQLRAWRRALHAYDDQATLPVREASTSSLGSKKRRGEGVDAGGKEHAPKSRARAAWGSGKGKDKAAAAESDPGDKENSLPAEGSDKGAARAPEAKPARSKQPLAGDKPVKLRGAERAPGAAAAPAGPADGEPSVYDMIMDDAELVELDEDGICL